MSARIDVVGTAFLRRRPEIVGPGMVAFVGALVYGGAPRLQIVALGVAFTVVLSWFLVERHLGRSRTFGEAALFRSLALTQLALTGLTVLTGGIASPAVPMLFAPLCIGLAAFGRRPLGTRIVFGFGASLLFLWLVAPRAPFPPLPPSVHRLALIGAMIDAALLLRVGITSLAEAHVVAARELAEARNEVIAASRARHALLEQLGARVAHEVKNPLAAVRAIVELTLETADDKSRRRLGVAAAEVSRIETVLRDYLSLTRPVAELSAAETDLRKLVEELALIFESRAAADGIELVWDSPSLAWTLDTKGVREALINLVVNAFEATSCGGRIAITCRENGDAVSFTVGDTGRGMRAEGETGNGSGIGVALARQVAHQHGGTLTFESRAGEGTKATLSLGRLS